MTDNEKSAAQVLVACVGNIFLGDDGFGVEVARRLLGRPLPPGVTVRDFGIRSLDLAYALLEPHDLIILVDACQRGGQPGSVYLIEPDATVLAEPGREPVALEAHAMNLQGVLRAASDMGAAPGRVVVVGCEIADLGPEEGKLGLSDIVAVAVEQAVLMIETMVASLPGSVAGMVRTTDYNSGEMLCQPN